MKKQETNLIKSFIALQENITHEQQKLYDKIHDLELSHNRKIKALQKIKDYTKDEYILTVIKNALFCNGRIKMKPLLYPKMEIISTYSGLGEKNV